MHRRGHRLGFTTRREMLTRCASGFGAVALSAMLADGPLRTLRAGETPLLTDERNAYLGFRNPAELGGSLPRFHHRPRAKSVIVLYMDGGPSQVDTFDPKPELTKRSGQPFPMTMEPTQFASNGLTLGSPWKFSQHGESGLPISELFPHVAKHADKLCVIRSMTSEFPEHTSANYFLHTGHGLQGRPSWGSWASYGLGSECQNLPSFVVLNGGLTPPGGADNFLSGFLPASHQASVFDAAHGLVPNIKPHEPPAAQRRKLDLLAQLNQHSLDASGHDAGIEGTIRSFELAFAMQATVPSVADLSSETAQTQAAYGLETTTKGTASFGRQCLMARRLVEQGVRFVELTCPNVGHDRWDQHDNLLGGHTDNAMAVDQPIAALLADLHARGLLETTLVVWAGEFGRTPFAQGTVGRDHNPFAFSIWLAGGGIAGGQTYGATDEFGYKVVEGKLEIHDLHATMLYCLGVDHEQLTYRYSGRDMRLTDVKGHVIDKILA